MSRRVVALCSAMLIAFPSPALAVVGCDDQTGEGEGGLFHITGSNIFVRQGPGTKYLKVKISNPSSISKKIDLTVNHGMTVQKECSINNWSKIVIVSPARLRTLHTGWVKNSFLSRDAKAVSNQAVKQKDLNNKTFLLIWHLLKKQWQ